MAKIFTFLPPASRRTAPSRSPHCQFSCHFSPRLPASFSGAQFFFSLYLFPHSFHFSLFSLFPLFPRTFSPFSPSSLLPSFLSSLFALFSLFPPSLVPFLPPLLSSLRLLLFPRSRDNPQRHHTRTPVFSLSSRIRRGATHRSLCFLSPANPQRCHTPTPLISGFGGTERVAAGKIAPSHTSTGPRMRCGGGGCVPLLRKVRNFTI